MGLGRFAEDVEKAVNGRETLTALIHCQITYSGRAESFIPRGDRVLILKSDGSVIIHQPEGNNPVNYMRPGSTLSFEKTESHLIMHVKNLSEKAWLDLEIYRVYDLSSRKLEDGQKIMLAGNEKDMSDWIRDNPQCISPDFRPVSREEHTDVGFIDVFGHNGTSLVVVECKRITASLTAVDQLRRYVERVKKLKGTSEVIGVLAAPAITPNAEEMLKSKGFLYRKVEPPKRLERWQRDQKILADY